MSFRFARRAGASVAVLAMVAAGCGGGGDESTDGDVTLRSAGDISVDADDVATTTTTEAVAAAGGASEGDEAEAGDSGDETVETTTTLPQEELDPGEALFQSIGVFQSCLDADGFEFIGIPGQASTDPDAPVNQQPYIDSLIACAARSQIQERIAAVDAAQADLTPEEIEDQNRQFVEFRDCMIGRGWDIPEPVPNERGLLFGGLGQTSEWTGPPGETLAETDDVGECTSQAGVTFGNN